MNLKEITQIISCAYTYPPSAAMRKKITEQSSGYHSSKNFLPREKEKSFSYNIKGIDGIVLSGEPLVMRNYPSIDEIPKQFELPKSWGDGLPKHWSEPEIAVLLGQNHEIVAYTLANDFTAIGLEQLGRHRFVLEDGTVVYFDGTNFGKNFYVSTALGPRWVYVNEIGDPYNLMVHTEVENHGIIKKSEYSTKKRTRNFDTLPDMIISYWRALQETEQTLPPSKIIEVNNGMLTEGTVILTGTYVPIYNEVGDVVTISCEQIGKLWNRILIPE